MAYCMAPYRNVYINNGKARPCCWYERRELKNKVDNLIDIVDVFQSEEFDKTRENPTGCWKCQMHEKEGGKSHRMLWNEREPDDGRVVLENLDIYMGNLCNLACVTCSSHNSSKWITEERKVFGESFKDTQDDIDTNLSWELVKDLKRIKFAGGEVLLMPHHDTMLQQLIDFDVAKNITLVYITNGTVDPGKFAELWKQFSAVEFIMSVDGIGEVSDYVRYHSSWNEMESNILKMFDYSDNVSINCVVSMLNVYHMPELLEWWNNRGEILFRILDYPQHLSIKCLNERQRQVTVDKIKNYPELDHIVRVLETAEYQSPNYEWIDKLDKNRNNSFWRINKQYVS